MRRSARLANKDDDLSITTSNVVPLKSSKKVEKVATKAGKVTKADKPTKTKEPKKEKLLKKANKGF